MSAIKGTSRRTWLTDQDLQTLRKISEKTKLGQTELLSQIVSAGLISLAEKGHTFQLPLRFETVE